MTDLNFNLHKKQREIFASPARFKVCAAGRRGGKTHLANVIAGTELMKSENERGHKLTYENEVWYLCPTFEQGKKVMWKKFKETWGDLIQKTYENTCTAEMINRRTFRIIGTDEPARLRGSGLSYLILDEFATMKSAVWDVVARPMLMEVSGGALFIGTPEGKNHFYDIWTEASNKKGWESFHFSSKDNPLIPREEFDSISLEMSAQALRQEIDASFEAAGGGSFEEKEFIYEDEPRGEGNIYIAVDPAGFGDGDGMIKSNLKKLDECAIAVVEVGEEGWFVHDIIHGRWGVRETSLQIIRAAQKWKAVSVGIEKGALKNAIMPYLEDQMRRLNSYPRIEELTHGGRKKTERITWALQGRFQNGRIIFKKGADYIKPLTNQLLDFPNPLSHDDLIDALAYIDQISSVGYFNDSLTINDYEFLDEIAGY